MGDLILIIVLFVVDCLLIWQFIGLRMIIHKEIWDSVYTEDYNFDMNDIDWYDGFLYNELIYSNHPDDDGSPERLAKGPEKFIVCGMLPNEIPDHDNFSMEHHLDFEFNAIDSPFTVNVFSSDDRNRTNEFMNSILKADGLFYKKNVVGSKVYKI